MIEKELEIKILKVALDSIKTEFEDEGCSFGICIKILNAINFVLPTLHAYPLIEESVYFIPLFTIENAVIACIEKNVPEPDIFDYWDDYELYGRRYWWHKSNIVSRVSFIEWMIEQLEK